MKYALLNVADTGPLDSLVYMLQAIGYQCWLLTPAMQAKLRRAGVDCVLDINDLVRGMGYSPSSYNLGRADWNDRSRALDRFDLFVDVKAHRNYSILTKLYPSMAGKVLWYRINGGEPEHLIKDGKDYGNELDPPCPVLTPNQWYRKWSLRHRRLEKFGEGELAWCPICKTGEAGLDETACKAYPFWPRFMAAKRFEIERHQAPYEPPVCLIHNAAGWGYGKLIDLLRERVGLRVYGRGSPDGLIRNEQMPEVLSKTIAMIHLKSSDAPGYALYEAITAQCPVIVSSRLIWRCKMDDLFYPEGIPNHFQFDRATHDNMTDIEVERYCDEIMEALRMLGSEEQNRIAGYLPNKRLNELMWDHEDEHDNSSFRQFMATNFGA